MRVLSNESQDSSRTLSRNDRRRQRTRQQLLQAVETLVLSDGYEDTSAETIAELADLGRSTFYNHFDNKEDAVLSTLTERFKQYGKAAYVPLNQLQDRRLSIAKSGLSIFKAMAHDPLTAQLLNKPTLLVQAVSDSQGDFLIADLTEGVKQGHFNFIMSLDSLVSALTWGFTGLLIYAVNNDSVETTGIEVCKFTLLNIGLSHQEIESVISQIVRDAA